MIEPLRQLLDSIKPRGAHGWMFPNTIGGALDLANLAYRVIKPTLEAHGLQWKGWHAYRRGLATNLKLLGVDALVIQAILRHENVATTQRSYIKIPRPEVVGAMQRLSEAVVKQTLLN